MKIFTFNHGIVIRLLLIVALAAGMASLPGRAAQATGCGGTYLGTVTSTSDSQAPGTLHGEVFCGSSSYITFAPSLAGQTITLTNGYIPINRSMTIDGSALSTPVTISGNNASRIFNIPVAGPITMKNLILKNGKANNVANYSQGGAIYTDADLTLMNMTFTDNHTNANFSQGGAIFNTGYLIIEDSTFSGNSATSMSSYGGAIYNIGYLDITDSTFSGNSARSDSSAMGGAIYSGNPGILSVTNSTFSGNSAHGGSTAEGGALYVGTQLTVLSSTISVNSALVGVSGTGDGGGIFHTGPGDTGTVFDTIVAGNTGSSGNANCSGPDFNGDFSHYNLTDDASCVLSFTNSTSINLGTLGNYGGPTQTIPLLAGSSALNGDLNDYPGNCPDADQRGVTRPVGTYCDIGAFEYDPVPQVTISSSSPTDGVTLSAGISSLKVVFGKNVLHDGSANAANNPVNYMLIEAGANGVFDTLTCLGGRLGDDTLVIINSVSFDDGTFTATLAVNGGVPLPIGSYKLFVCGTTSITDLFGLKLNYGLSDATLSFRIGAAAAAPAAVPATGFAPNRVTALPVQTTSYADLGDLWLEIPALGVQTPIVGVPQANGSWDVSWLGKDAGWLNGSAFPTYAGNTVLTGHVYDAYGKPGPFAGLNRLWYGSQVIIHAWGGQYVYEVRAVMQVAPGNTAAMMKHQELPWITLVTCRGYDQASNSYKYRVLVRAVLVDVK